jgi:molecular chaperone HscC
VLTDVMPFSLGIVTSDRQSGQLVGDRFSPIIERNTPVPVSRVKSYWTVHDQQRQIQIDIRQGESPIGSDNLHLGQLEVNVPAMKAGEAGVDVRFTYDANGLLEVDARERQSGNTVNTLIRNTSTEMSESQIQAALANLRGLKLHPRDAQDNRYLIERAKRLYEDRLGNERVMIQEWLGRFEAVLDQQDEREIRHSRKAFREALDSIDTSFRL